MKRAAMLVAILLCLGVGFATAVDSLIALYAPDIDWYSQSEAMNAEVPEGLDDWEAEIYRAGYANGHYDSRHPAYIEGVYVLNTDSRKFHRTDCMATVTLATRNREHLIGTRDDAINMGYIPCKMCNP